jgi:hypothetical protein
MSGTLEAQYGEKGQVQNKPLRLRFGRTGRSELDEESFVET